MSVRPVGRFVCRTLPKGHAHFCMSTVLPYKISVLVFIENRAGEQLLMLRAKQPNLGVWTPIGGKLEMATGESPFECAARETAEETGLHIRTEDLHLFAMAETCSHFSGPLSEGKLVSDRIVCPYHFSRFALEDGRVLDGPAVHPQPCLEIRARNGHIEVRKPNWKNPDRQAG